MNVYRALHVLVTGVFLSASFLASTAQAQSSFNADIVGVRLGMTEADVRAALQAFDPNLKITPVMGVFNYSD